MQPPSRSSVISLSISPRGKKLNAGMCWLGKFTRTDTLHVRNCKPYAADQVRQSSGDGGHLMPMYRRALTKPELMGVHLCCCVRFLIKVPRAGGLVDRPTGLVMEEVIFLPFLLLFRTICTLQLSFREAGSFAYHALLNPLPPL